MISDITLGQFFPGQSFLHRLDPRVKIVLLFFYITVLFIVDGAAAYGVLTAFAVFLCAASQIPARILIKSIRPLWWILLFTFLVHLMSYPGEVIGRFWIFQFTREGLVRGFFVSLRLVLLILLSSLLTLTTSPLLLTDALENLLSPLKGVGVPAHELAMMMTIALRFVPTLLEETDKIMKAQESRGADLSSGNIFARLKKLLPILVPLFISSFRRADELAMAMEARCYRGGEGRTRRKKLAVTRRDYIAIAATAVILLGLFCLKFVFSEKCPI